MTKILYGVNSIAQYPAYRVLQFNQRCSGGNRNPEKNNAKIIIGSLVGSPLALSNNFFTLYGVNSIAQYPAYRALPAVWWGQPETSKRFWLFSSIIFKTTSPTMQVTHQISMQEEERINKRILNQLYL